MTDRSLLQHSQSYNAATLCSLRKQNGSLLSSLLVLIFLAGGILMFADYLLQPDRFPIARVSFMGEFKHVERAALRKNVAPYIGENFFAMDLQKLEADIKNIDWISDVSVSRRWPDSLQVKVKETRLIAAWNKMSWVTSDGNTVQLPKLKMAGLPRWSGPEGTQVLVKHRYLQFSQMLSDVGMQLRELTYTDRGAWKIQAANYQRNEQVVIHLGRRDLQNKLYRFARAYAQTLEKLDQRLVSVDLRHPNGFAVKWSSEDSETEVVSG